MRICSLGLVRFGPFSDLTLDFGAEPGRIDLVYGANEAGKSTALRAISGLLFGIPRTTDDAHTHPMQELRVRGALLGADGRTLEIERLKRDKTSLVGYDGKPIEESLLEKMLGGVSHAVFSQTFGLDQAHLREGAEALLAGAGDVGESLFDAALGGHGVHRVLSEIELEAEGFFNPNTRAEKPRVNRALRGLKEAGKHLNLAVTGPNAWLDQREKLASVTARLAELDQRRSELLAEQQRLVLVREAAPLVADRARLIAELGALGPVPHLPADARTRRLEAEREQEFLRREIAHLELRIDEQRQKRVALDTPNELLLFDVATAEELRDRIGSHKKAERDLPKRQAELRALEADTHALVKRLGRRELGDVGALELDAAARARLRKLELSYGKLAAEENAERRTLLEGQERVSELESELDRLPPPRDFSELERTIASAARAGDLDAELTRIEKECSRGERSAESSLSRLGLASFSPASVLALAVPSQETIERFEDLFVEANQSRALVARETRENDKRLASAEQDLEALRRAGDVPSEDLLLAARARRESAWQRLIAVRLEKQDFATEVGKFEFALREADEVADRLRREEGRVRQRAEREAERERSLSERARLESETQRLEREARALDASWSESWQAVAIELLSPSEMRGWHARFSSALAEIERMLALATEREEIRAEIERHRLALGENDSLELSLGDLLDRAQKLLDQYRRASVERETRERALAMARAERDRSARRLAERSRENADWASKWKTAIAPLGFSADATPEEVDAVLDTVDQLSAKLHEAEKKRGQIGGIERDARELEADVEALVRRHAPDLSGRPILEAAHALLARHEEATSNLKLRGALDEEIESGERSLDVARERLTRADAELAVLMRQAGIETLEALQVMEDRFERALHIQGELDRIEARLSDVREGRSIEEIEAEIAGFDVRVARQRLEEIETERASFDEDRLALRQEVKDLEGGLELASSSKRAIEAEAEVQRHLAEARAGLDRWVRLTLASRLLRRQIERYRERHQGPVLERANRLFSTLTGGRYVGLRSDVDSLDRPRLRCVRSDGRRIDVAGLSEGARDQLYLALRLATLEHYAAEHEPLPLVLDDVLVTFDDERARAALMALAESARQIQVLLFTHEASVVALARDTLGANRVAIHELQRVETPRVGTTLELFNQQ